MELDEVKWKDPDTLSDEEKSFLQSNWDKLDDEDREVFASLKPEEKKEEEKEEDKTISFKSEEDLNAHIDKVLAQREEERAEQTKKEEEEKKTKEENKTREFFSKDYKPGDWNVAANEMFQKFTPLIVEATIEHIQNLNSERRAKLDKANQQLDAELKAVREENPDLPKQGTKEGDAFEAELTKIALENDGINMKSAFKIYRADHPARNEGEEETTEEASTEDTKRIAKKVGGSTPTGSSSQPRKYKDIASKSMDDIIEEAKARHGIT